VDEWEGRDVNNRSWADWKTSFKAAYINSVNRRKAGATDEPFNCTANSVIAYQARKPESVDLLHALQGLALSVASDRANVQQVIESNQSLTTSVVTLMASNKKLTDTVTRLSSSGGEAGRGGGGGKGATRTHTKAIWGQYCDSHGYKFRDGHTSKTCLGKKDGHQDGAMVSDTKGCSTHNKDWYEKGNQAS
jgi:hypothetical protein